MNGILIIIAVVLVYFLPSVISEARHHRNDAAIFILNLLLGWTVLGWIVALIWSFTSPTVAVQASSAPAAPSSSAGYCPHCGGARAAGSFCPGCGAKLS